ISSMVPDSATPVGVPILVQNIPTRMSHPLTSWRLIASWGRTPDFGVACVSHLTGSKTIDSATACWAFHSLTASVAACLSSAMSDGEAINTRYVCDLNDIGVILSGAAC